MTFQKNPGNHKKRTISTLLALTLLIAYVGTFAWYSLNKDKPKTSSNGPTNAEQAQQAKLDAQQKQSYLDETAGKDQGALASGDQGATSTNSTPATLSVSATQDSNSVTVLTQIHNIASGECKLTATRGTSNISRTASVIYQPQFSSCAGFSVPVADMGSGSWQITVVVTSDTNATLSQTITQEVK